MGGQRMASGSNRKTKILYASHSAAIAGAEVCLLTLIQNLDMDVFEPVVLFASPGPVRTKINELGVRSYVTPIPWSEFWVKGPSDTAPTDSVIFDRVAAITRIIEAEQPDLVHSNTAVNCEAAIAARLTNTPHVWHIHEILGRHPRLRPVLPLPFVYQTIDTLSDRVVAVSNAVRSDLEGIIDSQKLVVIHNGISTGTSAPNDSRSLRAELDVADDAVVAVTVGPLITEKGHDILLEAAAMVKRHGARVHFLLAGDGAPADSSGTGEEHRPAEVARFRSIPRIPSRRSTDIREF